MRLFKVSSSFLSLSSLVFFFPADEYFYFLAAASKASLSVAPAVPVFDVSVPVGLVPVGFSPVGLVPVGLVPVGFSPVGLVPVGLVPVGLVPVFDSADKSVFLLS